MKRSAVSAIFYKLAAAKPSFVRSACLLIVKQPTVSLTYYRHIASERSFDRPQRRCRHLLKSRRLQPKPHQPPFKSSKSLRLNFSHPQRYKSLARPTLSRSKPLKRKRLPPQPRRLLQLKLLLRKTFLIGYVRRD